MALLEECLGPDFVASTNVLHYLCRLFDTSLSLAITPTLDEGLGSGFQRLSTSGDSHQADENALQLVSCLRNCRGIQVGQYCSGQRDKHKNDPKSRRTDFSEFGRKLIRLRRACSLSKLFFEMFLTPHYSGGSAAKEYCREVADRSGEPRRGRPRQARTSNCFVCVQVGDGEFGAFS